jgi:hypothetical protein
MRNLWILAACAVLAVLVFNPESLIFISVFVGQFGIESVELKLQKPEVYKPAALTLATYCQSDQSLFPQILSYAWLPREVADLGHPWCEVSSNYAHVEFGGGFYHFGYSLERDTTAFIPATNEAFVPTTNVWNLYLVREEKPEKLLTTFPLASAQHVSATDLENLLCAYFDEEIRENQSDGYQGKVMAQLRFGRTAEAAITCQDWIKARPDSWLPRFAYAHIRCRLGETQAAAAQFRDWVNAHQTFGNDIYLALFNYREGLTNQAAQAVRTALGQPMEESPDEGGNVFYLAYNGAMIAYAGGDFDLCVSMCDKMLPKHVDRDHSYDADVFRRQALRIKAGAMLIKGRQSAALDLIRQAEAANEAGPFSHDDDAKADHLLEDAIRKNDTLFVKDPGKLADRFVKWFSPFSTDESEWHGPHLGIPTPYPSSWKTDEMNTNLSD